jgi:hypothetical protein
MFANGGIPVLRPERVRKVESLASAMHNVLERVDRDDRGGATTGLCHRHQRLPQARLRAGGMVAHHASPGTLQDAEEIASGAPQVLH